ncbi:MAG: nitroreductase family protein [Clostridia bacterium]
MDLFEALLTRRSVRSFSEEPVSKEDHTAIVRAGMHAPSAHDQQPWRMLSITNRRTLDQLVPLTPWWDLLHSVPLAIVICSDTRLLNGITPEFQVDGCVAATENMLLAAYGLGLGAVWLGICDGEQNYEIFKQIIGIPDYARVISMIAIGHELEGQDTVVPEDRLDQSKWFFEQWGNEGSRVV